MKKILLPLIILTATGAGSRAQDSTGGHVHWSFDGKAINDSTWQVSLSARIDNNWRLFSTDMPIDLPRTEISLDSASRMQARITRISPANPPIRRHDSLLDADIAFYVQEAKFILRIHTKPGQPELDGNISFMVYKGDEFSSPEQVPFHIRQAGGLALQVTRGGLRASSTASNDLKRARIDLGHPVNSCGGTGGRAGGLWKIFILGFLGGLVGLVMPCTFPMIPLTVSFFTKQSTDHRRAVFNASLYGFFIFLIYVLLSLPFYFLGANSSAILNNISTNAWLNIFFAAVFFVFSLSFFGLFEITLPGGMANKVGSRSGLGSVGGIFFMALTLAIVSFSCTGPILGTLLVGALNQNGGAVQLTVAMAGFGLALGLPFSLFAMFPRWLHALPKSGSWMNTVKIVFGFVELGLMIKFLSNADLVMHWGILKREVFFGFWILISLAVSLYLFGFLKFSHDPPPARISLLRKIFGLAFLVFAIYLAPGLTDTEMANRSLISGFPPPLSYSIYRHPAGSEKGVEANVVNDYNRALALAQRENKPVLIDFTGWACVNCRKMEENVWTDTAVSRLIRNQFILVSLYVDDRARLDKKDQFLYTLSDGSQKPIRTIGDKYGTLQAVNFGNASQPLYVIVSPDEKLLNEPVGYTPNAGEYAAWLRCGLQAFDQGLNAKR